jgi:hypothetical protein
LGKIASNSLAKGSFSAESKRACKNIRNHYFSRWNSPLLYDILTFFNESYLDGGRLRWKFLLPDTRTSLCSQKLTLGDSGSHNISSTEDRHSGRHST